ncbi:MAG: glycine cleavage system aminomethyltransferase GcvT [Nanoarchaeota archaeon]|nr:MAG: glycine cleavage system aminomethyltransferase GcvT [Nanoarchaeota archaeon]
MPELKRTPLYEVLLAEGGKFVDFVGWEMPVRFLGDIGEHMAVRNNAGFFDVSHMGEFEVRGREAWRFLQYLTTNNVRNLEPGKSQYSVMCNEAGGVIDDVIINMFEDKYIVVVNAAKIDEDWQWMHSHARGFDVTLTDRSAETILLSVQGRNSLPLLEEITEADIRKLKHPFRFVEGEIAGIEATISRTGYTGEPMGFELFASASDAVNLYKALREAGRAYDLELCGLGARDSLRLEFCLMLNGQDMNATTTPLEAGLSKWVKFEKGDFIGSEEMQVKGVKQTLIGFEMTEGRTAPRHNYVMRNIAGVQIGTVTSGGYSLSTGKRVGLGYVPVEYSATGSSMIVDLDKDGSKQGRALIVDKPFFKPTYV